MASFLRPDTDALDGNWKNESGNNTDLFASLDETSASDSDYIQSPVDPASEVCRIGLSNPTGVVQAPFTLSYRFNNMGGATLVVSLKQGTTTIATWEETGSGWTTQDRTLTAPQLAAISDFTNLFVEFSASGGDPTRKLNLDFTTGVLDSKVSLDRASAGTYYNASGLLASAGANTPRFDYKPSTLEPRGLRLEGGRTNLQLYSNTFSHSSWIKGSGAVVTAASGTGPDGANSAWHFTNGGGGSDIRVFHADLAGVASGDIITASVFVKRGGADPCDYAILTHQLASSGSSAWFNMRTGAWGTVQAGLTAHPPEALPNGWYRIALMRAHPGGALGVNDFFVGFGDADNSSGMTGGKTAFLFGAQFEVGGDPLAATAPTSYIETTSAAVSRAEDACLMQTTGFSSWYEAGPGTFVYEFSRTSTTGSAIAVTGGNDTIVINNTGETELYDNGVQQTFFNPGANQLAAFHKHALAYNTNDVGYVVDGGAPLTDATASLPTGFTNLTFGYHPLYGMGSWNLYFVKALKYYNVRKTNAELQALTGLPLALNFIDGTPIDSRVTFARSTPANYYNSSGVLVSAATNVPRIDFNPATLMPRGLLIEGLRTNLLLRSQEAEHSYWNCTTGLVVTANQIAAPDGTTTADKMAYSGTGTTWYWQVNVPGLTGYHCFSIYVKAGTCNFALVKLQRWGTEYHAVIVNLTTGVVTQRSTNGAGALARDAVENVGNGWWRVSVAADATGQTNIVPTVSPMLSGTNTLTAFGDPTTGGGSTFIYVWGAQLEQDVSATSYIPTTTVAVSVGRDDVVMTGTNFSSWWNNAAGTMVWEGECNEVDTTFGNVLWMVTDGSGSNRNLGYIGQNLSVGWYLDSAAGGAAAIIDAVAFSPRTPFKQAAAYALNDGAACINGGTVGTDTSFELPVGLNQLQIGYNYGGSTTPLKGWVRKLTYYPTRKTNSELQALST